MKSVFLKKIAVAFAIILTFTFVLKASHAFAYEEGEYLVREEEGGYALMEKNDGELSVRGVFENLNDVFEVAKNGSVYFDKVTVSKLFDIDQGMYTFSGSIEIENEGCIEISNSSIFLNNITVSIKNDRPIRIKSGTVKVDNSTLSSENSSLFLLDYSSSATLEVNGGNFISNSKLPLIKNSIATVAISGGVFESKGNSVENSSTLIIGGTPLFENQIISENPITISENLSSEIEVLFNKEFSKGEIYCLFYSATPNTVSKIKVYDASQKRHDVTYFDEYSGITERKFGAVYLPYQVEFYTDKTLYKTVYLLKNERLGEILPPNKEGYDFKFWSLDGLLAFDMAGEINRDIELEGIYKLIAPKFTLNSLSFCFDNSSRELFLNNLSHPLLQEGNINYAWYKDGEYVSSDERLEIKNVSDSGEYYCDISFYYKNDAVNVKTPKIEVAVAKAEVEIIELSAVDYTGEHQTPVEKGNSVYDILCSGGVDAGNYTATLILKDSENYRFAGTEQTSVEIFFTVRAAKNVWIENLKVENLFVGERINPQAKSRFGEVKYQYSTQIDKGFSDKIPTAAGEYYVKAAVAENSNYTALESEAVKFSIYPERVISLAINSQPDKKVYKAFEEFSAEGLKVIANYDSGRKEEISNDKINFQYINADNFRFGEQYVIAEYLGASITIPVTVLKADYDFSGFSFSDKLSVFNGKRQSIFYEGALPVGKDGSVPEIKILGGGINVGTYTVMLEFTVKSPNYNTPETMIADICIQPLEVELFVENTDFVYDGEAKIPTAYYKDIFSERVYLEVVGEKSLAGSYNAVAIINDSNYKLKNSQISFAIEKAVYDMSNLIFSNSDFTYDGENKRVEIIGGLPSGVTVVGYSNNIAKDAGIYYADFTFDYDCLNYQKPEIEKYKWEIKKGEYNFNPEIFTDNCVEFDGETHYPILISDMPEGVDGSLLKYKFSTGAVHVDEGKVEVKIEFDTDSNNYNTPNAIIRYVQILPRNIVVKWDNVNFVYNENPQCPIAISEYCKLVVLGEKTNAGTYFATAVSLDNDYKIQNDKVEYVIQKADNLWIEYPSVKDVYFGQRIKPNGVAKAGEVSYKYYLDQEMTMECESPSAVGIYYVVAFAEESENYKSIQSLPLKFEVIEIIPVSLQVSLNRDFFTAFETVGENDIVCSLLNNDGSVSKIDFQNLKIEYPSFANFRFGDEYVDVSYGDSFKVRLSVRVLKADYDLSEVRWENIETFYNGEEQRIRLVGLPVGVSILEYIGGSGVNAGRYSVSVRLDFDRVNYNEPIVKDAVFIIQKMPLSLPDLQNLTYNGKTQYPIIPESEYYTAEVERGLSSGEYKIILKVKNANCAFNGKSEVSLAYKIEPIKLTVKIQDSHRYYFEQDPKIEYEIISGRLLEGDKLNLVFEVKNGRITATSGNANYEIEIIEGNIVDHNAFSPEGKRVFLWILFSTLVFITAISSAYVCRYRIRRIVLNMKYHFKPVSNIDAPINVDPSPIPTQEKDKEEISLGVNAEQADGLISDDLAKGLLKKENSVIYTQGNKKGIINVDTLSDNFSTGDRVDINDLKSKKLIPYDTGYIKVLARGMIDKSLRVYANDFSLAAVKMIALTGGEANRVVTKSKGAGKNKEKP